MSESRVLVTFDIDGTLLIGRNKGSVHRNSFRKALKDVFGVDADLPHYKPGTDLGISKQIIMATTECENSEIDPKLLQQYIKKVQDHYLDEFDGKLDVMPGVFEALEQICKLDNVTVGFCTGNFSRIAMIKVEKAGLSKFFPDKIGGFGDNYESRTDILREAQKKAHEITGMTFNRFIHVGDSPEDVEAANTTDTTSVLVLTTPFDFDKKDYPHASYTFSNLKEHLDDFVSVVKTGHATQEYISKKNK